MHTTSRSVILVVFPSIIATQVINDNYMGYVDLAEVQETSKIQLLGCSSSSRRGQQGHKNILQGLPRLEIVHEAGNLLCSRWSSFTTRPSCHSCWKWKQIVLVVFLLAMSFHGGICIQARTRIYSASVRLLRVVGSGADGHVLLGGLR